MEQQQQPNVLGNMDQASESLLQGEASLGIKKCRLCLQTSSPETMIKPCSCDGELRYVHRKCLNDMRALSWNTQAFMRCKLCQQEYWITRKNKYSVGSDGTNLKANELGVLSKEGKRKLCWYKFRDSVLALMAFQFCIILFATIIGCIDSG